jgi:hypothetical protein
MNKANSSNHPGMNLKARYAFQALVAEYRVTLCDMSHEELVELDVYNSSVLFNGSCSRLERMNARALDRALGAAFINLAT